MKIKYTILSIWLLLFTSVTVHASQLKVVTSEWTPYVGKDLPKQGLAIDIVNTALQRAGYKPVIEIKNWTRTLKGVEVGVYDVIAAAWYSKQRAAHFSFSKPYLYNEIKLLKRADSGFEYQSPADLKDRLVGVVKNYAYGAKFQNAQGVLKVEGPSVWVNILDVLNGKLELTLDDERVLQFVMRHHMGSNKRNLVILPTPVSRNGLHIAVSKENPAHKKIVQAFDKAIISMKKDGTFAKIVKSHAND